MNSAKFATLGRFGMLAVLLTACFTTTPLIRKKSMGIPAGLNQQAIAKAISDSALELGWVIDKEKVGASLMHLEVRDHKVDITLEYDAKSIDAIYGSSKNLNYDGTNIHKKYHMWIDKLFQTIKLELNKASHKAKRSA